MNQIISMKFKYANASRGNISGSIQRGPRCHLSQLKTHSCRQFWFLPGESEEPHCTASVSSTKHKCPTEKLFFFFFLIKNDWALWHWLKCFCNLFTPRRLLKGPLDQWACKHYSVNYPWVKLPQTEANSSHVAFVFIRMSMQTCTNYRVLCVFMPAVFFLLLLKLCLLQDVLYVWDPEQVNHGAK